MESISAGGVAAITMAYAAANLGVKINQLKNLISYASISGYAPNYLANKSYDCANDREDALNLLVDMLPHIRLASDQYPMEIAKNHNAQIILK